MTICLLRNDSLLVLDEIGEMDPKTLGETAYMIANGSGRKRANKAGDGKSIKKWKTLLLSNGEKTLSAHITDGGKAIKAGQEMRTIKDLAGYIYDKPDGSRIYLVNRDVFKREICKGIREQKAKEILFKRKWLIKSSNGWQTSHHIPHLGTTDWFFALLPPVSEK